MIDTIKTTFPRQFQEENKSGMLHSNCGSEWWPNLPYPKNPKKRNFEEVLRK